VVVSVGEATDFYTHVIPVIAECSVQNAIDGVPSSEVVAVGDHTLDRTICVEERDVVRTRAESIHRHVKPLLGVARGLRQHRNAGAWGR
jgi:hypothetical protein